MHSQRMTVAASAMAERTTFEQRLHGDQPRFYASSHSLEQMAQQFALSKTPMPVFEQVEWGNTVVMIETTQPPIGELQMHRLATPLT